MKRWHSYIGFGVSIVFLYLVFFKPDFTGWMNNSVSFSEAFFGTLRISLSDINNTIKLLRPAPAIISFSLLVISMVIRSWRWQQMIIQIGPVSLGSVFWTNSLGYLVNNVLPLRAGEFIRAIIIGQKGNLSKVSMFSVIVLERVVDLAGLAVLFGLVLIIYPFPQWLRIGGAILTLVIAIVLVVCTFIAKSQDKVKIWINSWIDGKHGFLKKLAEMGLNLIDGLSVLRKRSAVINIAWTSILLWVIYVSVMKFALDAFGFTDGRFPDFTNGGWIPAAVLTIMTTLGLGIPSAPGGMGTYHGAALLTLTWFSVPEATSVVFATTMHIFMTTTLNLLGLLGMWQLGVSWKSLMKNVKDEQSEKADSNS